MAPNESAFKLTSALRRVSVEAMITTTSGLSFRTLSTASRPLRNVPTISTPDSSESHREIKPRTTTASSTIMTRIAGPAVLVGAICGNDMMLNRNSTHRTRHGTGLPPKGARQSSDQADFLKLRLDDFLVERLH